MVYAVLYHNQLVGLYTSATDANMVVKQLHGAVIQECRLNTETDVGGQLLRNPA